MRHFVAHQLKHENATQEAALIDDYITWAKDERTALAKWGTEAPKFAAIECAHEGYVHKSVPTMQQAKNIGHNIQANAKRALQNLLSKQSHVQFASKAQICYCNIDHKPITVTYDSGANGHYISENGRNKAGLPILRKSRKRVGVANGAVSVGNKVTR